MQIRPRRRLLASALALAVAACQPSPVDPSPTATPAKASGAPTATPIATPATTPTLTDVAARELPPPNASLPAGRYADSDFAPRVTFQVGNLEWVASEQSDGLFAVLRAVGPGSGRVITLRFARPVSIHAGPDSVREPTTAAEAVSTLRENPSFTHLGSSPGRTGGLASSVIEIEGVGAETWPVFETPASTVELPAGRRMWIAFLDVPDGVLAIAFEGSAANWDGDLGIVEPVLESVTIGR